jgi:hypothetical protein
MGKRTAIDAKKSCIVRNKAISPGVRGHHQTASFSPTNTAYRGSRATVPNERGKTKATALREDEYLLVRAFHHPKRKAGSIMSGNTDTPPLGV